MGEAPRRAAVATALDSLEARNPIEQMFTAHAVASHHATMECLRRAMQATAVKDLQHRQAPTTLRRDGQDRILGGKTP